MSTAVAGSLAGRSISVTIDIDRADHEGLTLSASGPFTIDVTYELRRTQSGSDVRASVDVDAPRGLSGRLLASAAGALLSADALDHALRRIVDQAGRNHNGPAGGE